MVNNKVGKRIREYREKANISQEQMADKIGLSVTAISNIERGVHYPSFENFIKISNAVGVSSDMLLLDVIDAAYVAKSSEISEKLKEIPPDKRQQIFAVIDTMLEAKNF